MRKLALALPLIAMAAMPAVAQDGYPAHPITLIVTSAAGGSADTLARIFATPMSRILGQDVVVENRPGASTVIGTQMVAEARPDGYTLGMASNSSHTFAPLMQADLPYDPIEDFDPIYIVAKVPNVLVVNAELGVTTLQELVTLVNERPGELNYSSGGSGTVSHFAGAMFVALAGIADSTEHIPYQGGAQASVAAAAGEVQFYVGPLGGNLQGVLEAGKVIPLAISGETRAATLPDVPTFAEAGMPEYTATGVYGLVAPAGTPSEIIARLNAAAIEASRTPEVAKGLESQGVVPIENTPEDYAALIRDDLDSHRSLVEDGVVTLE